MVVASTTKHDCLYLLFILVRHDCDAINEICSRHYVGHPTHNNKKRLEFEVGDKVCCTKNAFVNEVSDPNAVTPLRLCNGEIFFIEDVSYTTAAMWFITELMQRIFT